MTAIHCHAKCEFNQYGRCAKRNTKISETRPRCLCRRKVMGMGKKVTCKFCGRDIIITTKRQLGKLLPGDEGA